MARGLNKVMLIGNAGKEPNVNTTSSGQKVATFSLATTEEWNDQNGQRQSRTEWHYIVAWGKLAEIVGAYVHTGTKIYIEGRIQSRSYQDKNGQDRNVTEVVANEMILLPSGGGQNQNNDDFSGRAGGSYGGYGRNNRYNNSQSGAGTYGNGPQTQTFGGNNNQGSYGGQQYGAHGGYGSQSYGGSQGGYNQGGQSGFSSGSSYGGQSVPSPRQPSSSMNSGQAATGTGSTQPPLAPGGAQSPAGSLSSAVNSPAGTASSIDDADIPF